MNKKIKTAGPLEPDVRAKLVAMVSEKGEAAVMSELGLHRLTLARAAAGFTVHFATRCMIAQALAGR